MSQEIRRRLAARAAGNRRPADTAIPNYGRGAERLGERPSKLHVGRYSEGHEAVPEHAAGKDHIGRFSDGLDTDESTHVGRYSDGAPAQPAA
jgi:hypothetical protein